jgi:hypothetical protein
VRPLAALIVATLLSGCGEATPSALAPAEAPSAGGQAGYLTPPAVVTSRLEGAGIALSGTAPPKSRVRLATPQGEALFAEADGKGAWRLTVPSAGEARIFGLSATTGERTAQGEGYLLLTAAGEAVLLRAGAGALRIGRGGASRVDAVDFDRDGRAVVSGRAPANAELRIHVDGGQTAEGRADAQGRYAISLPEPIAAGPHQIDVFGDAAENSIAIDARPAAPISNGPFRSAAVPGGLRVDWMTPGGGLQSTLLLE